MKKYINNKKITQHNGCMYKIKRQRERGTGI